MTLYDQNVPLYLKCNLAQMSFFDSLKMSGKKYNASYLFTLNSIIIYKTETELFKSNYY